MIIGVDYYPEHWDKSLWIPDADLMAETGVKLVRMAEFAWCRLEPADGEFDFSWLDEIIGILKERGIGIILGTPTNCPPRWLCESHPSILPVGSDGRPNPIGIRGHRCYNDPTFREYAKRIIKKMAEHYKEESAIVGWQIDNELEANICYCVTCNQKHRKWLKNKYRTLWNLNHAYGNVVWSGEYSSWDQIDPPYGNYNSAWLNPSYMLDYRRRCAEDVTEFCHFQADTIRQIIPTARITTNTWFCENMPDFYSLFQNLDYVSYDNYPTTSIPSDPEDIYTHAVHLDLMRGIKRDNFCIMEQLSGGMGCWSPMSKTTRPGMIKGYALQAFAHGADTVLHFRWRTATIGAEMHWHGLIDHSNVPGRRFEEFADLCKAADQLAKYRDTRLVSKVAILYSVDSEYAFKLQPQTDGMYYMEQIKLLHSAFASYGINVDIIDQRDDLTGYQIVCAPEIYITEKVTAHKLYTFTEQGGTVILTTRTGVKDLNNNCIMQPLPGIYAELAGCHVEEYDPIGYDTVQMKLVDQSGTEPVNRIASGDTTQSEAPKRSGYTCKQWCDILEPDTAEVLAVYDSEFYQGKAAVTRNTYGSGHAYYIGTVGERAFYRTLAGQILEEADIPYFANLPDGVEITTRIGKEQAVLFIFNNSDHIQDFQLMNHALSLQVTIQLQPFEMKIIETGL